MSRKAILTALAVGVTVPALVVPVSGGVVHAEESTPVPNAESDFSISVKEDNTVAITKYTGVQKNVVLPSSIDGKLVTEIGKSAFENKLIDSVYINEGVTVIGVTAFYKSTVKKVTLPNSLVEISNWAFKESRIDEIILPKNLKIIGDEAFRSTRLYNNNTTVVFPEGLEEINQLAFTASGVKVITLPKTLKKLGSYAFKDNKLESINMPNKFDNQLSINLDTFNSHNLKGELTIPENVVSIGKGAFERAWDANNWLTTVKLPNTLTTIGDNAFKKNKINKIHIPSSVVNMGTTVFDGNYDYPFELTIQGEDPSKAKNYAQGNGHTFEMKIDEVTLPEPAPEPDLPPTTEEPTEEKDWSLENHTSLFKGVIPTITVMGGKPAHDITIKNVEWVTTETDVTTPQGNITLKPDGNGNTLVSVKEGLGDKTTATTINVEFEGTNFIDINIVKAPELNFNFSLKKFAKDVFMLPLTVIESVKGK